MEIIEQLGRSEQLDATELVGRHQLEMDGSAEIVAEYEAAHEPLTEAEIEAAAREMFGSDGAGAV